MKMRKLTWATMGLLLLLMACQDKPHFSVNGFVYDAAGKMLFLEAAALDKVVPVDSVVLRKDGSFHLEGLQPSEPEFYRLRVDDKVISLSIDSTETIVVESAYEDFGTRYMVSGSESCQKIKDLVSGQLVLQHDVNELMRRYQKGLVCHLEDSLYVMLKNYKQKVARQYILPNPCRPYAYFALFQKLNGFQIFDPLNSKDDLKSFAAVATCMNNSYPHSLRSKNLYNITIRGMKNIRSQEQTSLEVPSEKIAETGIININLNDLDGNPRQLSELKGKVVLLDFNIYQSQVGAPHNMQLKELYAKYKDRGFEIYQVSFDEDEHFWKTSADHLPWVCVRDVNGVYSSLVGVYNVQQIPCFYLINRENELCMSNVDISNLDSAIKSLL